MHSTGILLFFLLASRAFGQGTKPESSFLLAARHQAVATYERAMYEQAHVYEGNEYITHDHRIKFHPFYRSDSLQAGTITYNGVSYHGVQMLYDIVRDELAVQPPESGYRLRVRNDKISAFSMGGHPFVRIVGDSTTGIPTGFYELLHTGKINALARRIKTVHEDISSGSYLADYVPKDRFFIQRAGIYQEVKTKRSVLTLFPEQAKALRKYIRDNKLKFNDDQREEAIARITQRYEELSK